MDEIVAYFQIFKAIKDSLDCELAFIFLKQNFLQIKIVSDKIEYGDYFLKQKFPEQKLSQ